jgi:RHS repeat-associated protein
MSNTKSRTHRCMKSVSSIPLMITITLLSNEANARVTGWITGVKDSGSGRLEISGWACNVTQSNPINISIYVGGPAGVGVHVGDTRADKPREQGISSACHTSARNYGFDAPLTNELRLAHGGKPIYIYGNAIDGGPPELLTQSGRYAIPTLPTAESETIYFHTDQLGSTVLLTDRLANTIYEVSYLPYGESATGTKSEAPGYTGHYEDPLTKLTYMQARYYDADLGRFLSIDPLPPTPGNLFNFGRYGYANANPLSFVDPTGMATCGPSITYLNSKDEPVTHHLPNMVCDGGGGSWGDGWGGNSWGGNPWGGSSPALIGGGGSRPSKPTDLDAVPVTADPPRALPPFLFRPPPSGPVFKDPWHRPIVNKVDDFLSNKLIGYLTKGAAKFDEYGKLVPAPGKFGWGLLIYSPRLGGCDGKGYCADEAIRHSSSREEN